MGAAAKQAQHLDNVKREIKILTRLRGTLSVVHFKGAYEDDQSIHLVMELCRRGGCRVQGRAGRADGCTMQLVRLYRAPEAALVAAARPATNCLGLMRCAVGRVPV